MITSAMSTAIAASRQRVWHALTTPSELIRWNDQLIALLDPLTDYPRVGQRSRWRVSFGSVEIIAHQTIRDLLPLEKLQSAMAMGLFRFDETYGLSSDPGDGQRTHLGLRVIASNSLPVVGGSLDRFAVRELATDLIDARLRSIQKWCENH